jgi:hypothetical protein
MTDQPQEELPKFGDEFSKEELNQAELELKAMTPIEWLVHRRIVSELEETAKQNGEATGIAWGTLEAQSGGRINITARSYAGPVQAIVDLGDAVAFAKTIYGMKLLGRDQPKSGQENTVPPVGNAPAIPSSAPANVPPPPPPPSSFVPSVPGVPNVPGTPAAVGEKKEFVLPNPAHVNKITVVPAADGRATVNFFLPNAQYATFYLSNRPVGEIISTLSRTGAWTPQHFSLATEYNVNFSVVWALSEKLNSKGNPYKNIVEVNPGS